VLKSIPWDKVDITVISFQMQFTVDGEKYFHEMSEYLKSNGYEENLKLSFDDEKIVHESIWVRQGVVLSDYKPKDP